MYNPGFTDMGVLNPSVHMSCFQARALPFAPVPAAGAGESHTYPSVEARCMSGWPTPSFFTSSLGSGASLASSLSRELGSAPSVSKSDGRGVSGVHVGEMLQV